VAVVPTQHGADPVENDSAGFSKWYQVHSKVVRWRQAEVCGDDCDELQKHAKVLPTDLKEAGVKILVQMGYFDEDLPTQTDETRRVFPTVVVGKNLEEDGECLDEHDNEQEEYNNRATKRKGNEGKEN